MSRTPDSLAPVRDEPTGFDTGAFLPKDMTVRLVRADAAGWEVFISLLYSIALMVFSLFLGSWITTAQSPTGKFSALEKTSCISFGVLAIVLGGALIILKKRQSKNSIKVPVDMLKAISCKDDEEA